MSEENTNDRIDTVLAVAQRAMARCTELERRCAQLEHDRDNLVDQLTEVKLRLSEQESDTSYDPHDLDGNVGKVREHAFKKAINGTGHSSLDYDDVMWEVFDGQPSAEYCYKLMKHAAKAPGFEYRHPGGKGIRLTVNSKEAKKGLVFSSAKKTTTEGVPE